MTVVSSAPGGTGWTQPAIADGLREYITMTLTRLVSPVPLGTAPLAREDRPSIGVVTGLHDNGWDWLLTSAPSVEVRFGCEGAVVCPTIEQHSK